MRAVPLPPVVQSPPHFLYPQGAERQHCTDSPLGGRRVIRRSKEASAHHGVQGLQVGQPDVHQSCQQIKHFRRLVRTGIPGDRQGQARLLGRPYAPCNRRDVVAAGHEVDVLRPGLLQLEAYRSELVRGNFPPHSLLGNLVVLAEGAAQRTAGKENRSAAAKNGQKRFLAKVQAGRRGAEAGILPAQALLPRRPVRPAFPGALTAGLVKFFRSVRSHSAHFESLSYSLNKSFALRRT